MPTSGTPTDRRDAELVVAAAAGDRDAFGEIYRRHADALHTVAIHLTRDREEAADLTAEVFLVAGSRLHQLRDPAKLKPWLFAILRHEGWRRTRRSRRSTPVEEVGEVASARGLHEPDVAADRLEATELSALVRDAAEGLDDDDRLILEFELQGLGGAALAEALGRSTHAAHQAASAMRKKLGRSVAALVVARRGRSDCADLDGLLAGWDGRLSVRWRKRVARHVDRCDVCGERGRKVPALVLDGVAAASERVVAPPGLGPAVAERVELGSAGRAWSRSGFPRRRRGRGVGLLAAVLAVLVLTTALWSSRLGEGTRDAQTASVAGGDAVPTTMVGSTATTAPSDTVPPARVPPVPPGGVAPTDPRPGGPGTSGDPGRPPTSSPAPTTTSPPRDVAPPVVTRLSVRPSTIWERNLRSSCNGDPALPTTAAIVIGIDHPGDLASVSAAATAGDAVVRLEVTPAGGAWTATLGPFADTAVRGAGPAAGLPVTVTVTATDDAGNSSAVSATASLRNCVTIR